MVRADALQQVQIIDCEAALLVLLQADDEVRIYSSKQWYLTFEQPVLEQLRLAELLDVDLGQPVAPSRGWVQAGSRPRSLRRL